MAVTETTLGIPVVADKCITRHTAAIYDRGGVRRVSPLVNLNSVTYYRTMDGKTQAVVVLEGKACEDQALSLQAIAPRRHELVIWRGTERVWEGPIVQVLGTSSYFQIVANDCLEYLDYTALSQAYPAIDGETIISRLLRILKAEMTTDYTMDTDSGTVTVTRWENLTPPVNLLKYVQSNTGVTISTAATDEFQMTLGDHLKALGTESTGVSYTMVGRSLVIWDGALGQTRTVTEKDFSGDIEVVKDGIALHTITHVSPGSTTAGQTPVIGHAANDQSFYGPWESIVTSAGASASSTASGTGTGSGSSSAAVQSAENTQARADLYGRYPVPVLVDPASGSTLVLGTGLGINDLVAGISVPVTAQHNILPVKNQMLRLTQLEVQETPASEVLTPTFEGVGINASLGNDIVSGSGLQ